MGSFSPPSLYIRLPILCSPVPACLVPGYSEVRGFDCPPWCALKSGGMRWRWPDAGPPEDLEVTRHFSPLFLDVISGGVSGTPHQHRELTHTGRPSLLSLTDSRQSCLALVRARAVRCQNRLQKRSLGSCLVPSRVWAEAIRQRRSG